MKNARRPDDAELNLVLQTEDADLLFVLSDPRGRRFIWRELGVNGLLRQTYSPNNSEQCFNAGQRNAAIRLLDDVMRVSPDLYLTMQQEAIEAEKRAQLIAQAQRERGQDNDD